MNISRENIEQYLLDYAEGRLSPARAGELLAFLSANPDLMPLLEQFDPEAILPIDTIAFPGKENLKKDIRLTADAAITFPAKDRLRKKAPLLPLRRLAWSISAAAAVVLLFIAIRFFTGPPVNDPVIRSGMESLSGESQTEENQQIETRNTKHQTRNTKHETPNTKHQTRNTKQSLAATITGTPSLSRIETRSANPLITYQANAFADFSPEEKALSHLSAFTTKDQPLIARVASGIVQQMGNQVREILPANGIPKPKFDLWSVAKAGVKGYNSMTDRELELLVEKDDEGNLIYYALKENDQVILKKAPGRE
ncbi:MAG: hypothetical protein K0B08_10590 [Bacteroidales bacterium]|nr:hypothetical protein [Bacteroidales bacterium]